MTTINTEQTQPQSQLDAQTKAGTAPAEPSMPIEPNQADLAVVLRVMNRAEIAQDTVARALNINKGHMSRMLSGDSPVPFQLVRYLWDKTSDLELLDLLGGPQSRVRLAAMPRDSVPVGVSIDAALPTVVSQLAEAAQQSRGGQPGIAAQRLASVLCLVNGALDTEARRAGELPASPQSNVQFFGYVGRVPSGKVIATA